MKSTGASVQISGIYWFKDLFLVKKKMSVDRVRGPVDHDRAVVYGSTVDHRRRWPKGSPELTLGGAPVSESLLAVGEKEKGAPRVPTIGEGGRCGAGGRPATVDQNGGGLELGAMRLEARGGEALGGMRCGEEQRCLERLL
jgi:hypothetical protein